MCPCNLTRQEEHNARRLGDSLVVCVIVTRAVPGSLGHYGLNSGAGARFLGAGVGCQFPLKWEHSLFQRRGGSRNSGVNKLHTAAKDETCKLPLSQPCRSNEPLLGSRLTTALQGGDSQNLRAACRDSKSSRVAAFESHHLE